MWEAILFAAHNKLSNFVLIVDQNDFQAMGRTGDVLSMENLSGKLESFDFEVYSCDGHDETAIANCLDMIEESTSEKPKVIVAKTTKGKGVSFMENDNIWHYTRLNNETYEKAIAEIKGKAK